MAVALMTFMMVAMHVITMVALMTMAMHHPGLYGRAVVAVWLSLAVLFVTVVAGSADTAPRFFLYLYSL